MDRELAQALALICLGGILVGVISIALGERW